MPPALIFFLSLLVQGALGGAIYALIAVSFVLVYKSSRTVNFALGEWISIGAVLTAVAGYVLGLRLFAAILAAAAGMAGFGIAFNALVVQRLLARPEMSLIMATIGLGAMMQGTASLLFAGIPGELQFPAMRERLAVSGVPVPPEKLIAAAAATIIIVLMTWFYWRSRTGVALRAIADDAQAAAAAGINPRRLLALLWGVTGAVSVVSGVLWVFVGGGGFGVALVGLKIFPIVIIGGLDSLPGTIVAAMLIGVLESLGSGYLDPQLGGGFGAITSYFLMMALLMMRPYGLFGRTPAARV